MATMTGPTAARSDEPGAGPPRTIRFRAANGATVAVTITPSVDPDRSRGALDAAREAISQIAEAQRGEAGPRPGTAIQSGACDAAFWSWALPEGWSRAER